MPTADEAGVQLAEVGAVEPVRESLLVELGEEVPGLRREEVEEPFGIPVGQPKLVLVEPDRLPAVGIEIAFSGLGLVAVGLAAWTLGIPRRRSAARMRRRPCARLASSPRMLLGLWLILLEACTLGALGTLLPLRLSHLGASGIAIGATFVVASVVSTRIAPRIG